MIEQEGIDEELGDDYGTHHDVDTALSNLALLAVSRLQVEMQAAKSSRDRIAAANSILDRLGYSRTARVQADAADREIRRALDAALAGGVNPGTAKQLSEMEQEMSQRTEKRLTRSEEQAQDQEQYASARRAEDQRLELAWEDAAPGAGDHIPDDVRDFSQLGPDDEETDAWLES